jgi:hypothetical protein
LNNQIQNLEGWSTSSEETPEYFGAKGALSFRNENIMCDITTSPFKLQSDSFYNGGSALSGYNHF